MPIPASPINLTRATPPITPTLNSALQATLGVLAKRDDLHYLVRSNRIGGSEEDRAACGTRSAAIASSSAMARRTCSR